MSDIAQTNSGFIPFVPPPVAGVSPQGFDFAQLAQQIAAQIFPLLPGLVTSVLSAHPTIGPQLRAQGASPHAGVPQPPYNFGFSTPPGVGGIGPFGATPSLGFVPQGIDFGQIAQQIASQVLPILPGLVLGVLSAHPVIGPQLRGQSAAPQAAVPFGLTPQGFDPSQLVQQVLKTALPLLPVLITSLLSAHPALAPQYQAQSALPGLAPQSLFNFGVNTPTGGAGIGLFGAAPSAGNGPQGFDVNHLTQQIAGQVVPILPGLITSILSSNPVLSAQLQARGQTTH
jgi:hypothetical protein